MKYYGDVYRPPSEARSLIIQCTLGCSKNTCLFCSMYKAEDFVMRKQEEILSDLQEGARLFPGTRRIFLADGDALVMPTPRLLEIIYSSRALFPAFERASSYATVKDILQKTDEDLLALRKAGLTLVYIGLESGSDEILRAMDKDQTQEEFVEAMEKVKKAGMKSSVTLIFGLGGREKSDLHIRESARAISRTRPDYLSFLSLQLSPRAPLFDQVRKGDFILLSDEEEMGEMRRFIEQTDSPGTVFRSNHASNPVAIAGTLNEDREKMLEAINRAVEKKAYRPMSWRGL